MTVAQVDLGWSLLLTDGFYARAAGMERASGDVLIRGWRGPGNGLEISSGGPQTRDRAEQC
jgi:hypothetical protein